MPKAREASGIFGARLQRNQQRVHRIAIGEKIGSGILTAGPLILFRLLPVLFVRTLVAILRFILFLEIVSRGMIGKDDIAAVG